MRRLLPALLLAVVAVAGCTSGGSDDGDGSRASDQPRASSDADGSTTPSPVPTGPNCSSVWKAGDTLDDDYELCVSDGAAGVQDVTDCEDGPPLIVFDDELFGRPGEEIKAPSASPVQDTEEYGKAYAACTGE